MADETNEVQAEAGDTIIVPAKLAPTGAAECRENALKALESATGSLTLDVDGDDPSACALQLLIATRRSAEAKGVSMTLTDAAETVFHGIEMH